MHLRNVQTKENIPAGIELLTPKELKSIEKNVEFQFDWNTQKDRETYKLYRTDTNEILGLMSVTNVPDAVAVEINLLEVGATNVGSSKVLDRVAGCLMAWACRLSFQRGFDGWLKVIAKNELIEHYKKKYGMKQIGQMQTCKIEEREAMRLIAEYLRE